MRFRIAMCGILAVFLVRLSQETFAQEPSHPRYAVSYQSVSYIHFNYRLGDTDAIQKLGFPLINLRPEACLTH